MNKQTYTRPATQLEAHILRNKEEGLPFSLSENENYVSVSTTLPFDEGRELIDVYRKHDGKRVTYFDEMRLIVHRLIQKG